MKKLLVVCSLFTALSSNAQEADKKMISLDTVIINAFNKVPVSNVPYQLQHVILKNFETTPRLQLMNQLEKLPSVSIISSGNGINKPVIRGLSFNRVQVFANGSRIDNQTWDDRHDIGISENGYDKVEVISGPAALIYGPNTSGGAIILEEAELNRVGKAGYVRLGLFGNSLGGNFSAGIKAKNKSGLYYSLHAGMQAHTNYVQGEEIIKTNIEEDKPLAFNSKFNNLSLKGMIGISKAKSNHRFTYNLYSQNLGIIEDEKADTTTGKKEEERDYEMEAPYQHVVTHMAVLENRFNLGNSWLSIHTSYQTNKREEFEPDSLPKSKFLGIGLDLQTITSNIQWSNTKNKAFNVTAGIQAFYQQNKNKGNFVLVPDAHVSMIGAFISGFSTLGKWNFLYGARIDINNMKMFTTLPKKDDGEEEPAISAPKQNITKNYTPASFFAGAVFHPTQQWNLKINIANGYTSPNYAQLTSYGKHEGTYRFEIGDNDLVMEKNIEADAGIEYKNENVAMGINGYINSIKNYVYITPTADSAGDLRVYRWAQHDANISGLEATAAIHPITVSWFEANFRMGIIKGKLSNNGGNLPYIPANKFITGITLKKAHWGKLSTSYVTLQGGIYSRQSQVATFEETTAGYFLADLFIGTTIKAGKAHSFNFTAFCSNLFNKGYYNHLSLIKSIHIQEPGRNVGLQVQYNF